MKYPTDGKKLHDVVFGSLCGILWAYVAKMSVTEKKYATQGVDDYTGLYGP